MHKMNCVKLTILCRLCCNFYFLLNCQYNLWMTPCTDLCQERVWYDFKKGFDLSHIDTVFFKVKVLREWMNEKEHNKVSNFRTVRLPANWRSARILKKRILYWIYHFFFLKDRGGKILWQGYLLDIKHEKIFNHNHRTYLFNVHTFEIYDLMSWYQTIPTSSLMTWHPSIIFHPLMRIPLNLLFTKVTFTYCWNK